MPLYEYQCKKCRHKFEKIQKFSDPPVKKCPECGGGVEKLLHAPGVQFKCSGWYVTDYAGKSSAKEGTKESSAHDSASTAKESSKEKAEEKPRKAESKKTK